MNSSLYLLCVLVLVSACSASGNTGASSPENSDQCANPLTASDLANLSAEERATLPHVSSEVSMNCYPDAVVFMRTSNISNPIYNEAVANGAQFNVDFREKTTCSSAYKCLSIREMYTCLSNKSACNYDKYEETVVLRATPSTGGISQQGEGLFELNGTFMLAITWHEVRLLLPYALQLKTSGPQSASCDLINQRLMLFDAAQYLNLVNALSKQGYVAYHQVQEYSERLEEYDFALRGCYDDDVVKKQLALSHGEEAVAWIIARH